MDRAVCLLAGYCFTIGLAAAGVATIAHAQEVVPSPPPGFPCQGECPLSAPLGIDPVAAEFFDRATQALATEFGNGMRFRVMMRHPALFTENTCNEKTCNGPGCGGDEGACAVGQIIASGSAPGHVFTAKFVRLGCPCSASGECKCGDNTADGKATCKCCQCAAASNETVTHETKCGEETCEVTEKIVRLHHDDEFAAFAPHKLMQQIAQLMAEKSAAQAALAVRKEADDQIGEIYEAMAELLADNAALDAKLEAQEESRKLVERVTELTAENARLKTHLELAAERAELARATTALHFENEKLKLRLAEVEQKNAIAEAARTAAKPRSERKAR
ncbi:MAG TPA: hypothetical protein VGI40_09860 [Pirellulaceae bacterium]|jgi:hypothetical protein